jgi:small GTP-binding protein
MEEELQFKILLLGESSVGKTCFLLRYCDADFQESISTQGIDSRIKDLERNDQKIKLSIYDTAGQERFRSLVQNLYKAADGILLIYDVSKVESFNLINKWINGIKENVDIEKIGFIVVGNKIDLPESKKEVNEKMKKDLEKQLGYKIIEASAKEDINVTESFELLVDKMIKLKEEKEDKRKSIKIRKNSFKNNNNNKNKKQECCLRKNK